MRQKLGQHFLINSEISESIAAALEVAAGDTIVEVGPGHGELTQEILSEMESAASNAARLVAIERDPALAAEVREKLKKYPFVEVVEADILKFLKQPAGQKLLSGPYKITGNLPYYLTGHLFRLIGEMDNKPTLAVFMIQKEVAERIVAEPPRMNRLAASVQFWAQVEIILDVPWANFNPAPEVDSAVVLLKPRSGMDMSKSENFYKTVRALFAQPRKTVLNNLRDAYSSGAGDAMSAEKASELLKGCGVDPQARPQDLSIEKIVEIGQRNQ